jgi:hypothetical protein
MRRVAKIVLTAALSSGALKVAGETITAGALRGYCESEARCREVGECSGADALQAQYCFGYMHGFINGELWALTAVSERQARLSTDEARQRLGYCIPENVTNAQLAEIYAKFANEHPEMLHQAPYFVARFALISAFPCR